MIMNHQRYYNNKYRHGNTKYQNEMSQNGFQKRYNKPNHVGNSLKRAEFKGSSRNNSTVQNAGKPFFNNQNIREKNNKSTGHLNKEQSYAAKKVNRLEKNNGRGFSGKNMLNGKQNNRKNIDWSQNKSKVNGAVASNQQEQKTPNLDVLFTTKPIKLNYCLAPERLEVQARALEIFEKKEREAKQLQRRSQKDRRHKLMTAKTRKGQPVMQGRMELLYEKVKNIVSQG
ncbi:GATA zinc finger domain-containing protein 24-like [Malaya genurostris]|uniref:GATA zinc finger domain-containing protein 24-like n=1 Tax=Malaya genurostris TaxID=325434 RepID=UPI0026F39EFB|nr:GATA zinc finger domain-containing protein 24-like [Malaya genurostris]